MRRIILFLASCIVVSSADAFSWNPVLSIGVGAAASSNLTESVNFPIVNPITDEFYNYAANQDRKTQAVFDAFLGSEWPLQHNWFIEMGLDYSQSTAFSAEGLLTQGADISSEDTYNYQYKVQIRELLAESKLFFTVKKWIHPYVLAGLGVGINNAYHYNTNAPINLTFTRLYSNNIAPSFSYVVGAGVDTDVSQSIRLGVVYRFTDAGKIELGSGTIDESPVSGTLSQSHLYANEIMAQLTCHD